MEALATIAKILAFVAPLAPEVAELGELKTALDSGDPAQLDAMLARLQAENDQLAQA